MGITIYQVNNYNNEVFYLFLMTTIIVEGFIKQKMLQMLQVFCVIHNFYFIESLGFMFEIK